MKPSVLGDPFQTVLVREQLVDRLKEAIGDRRLVPGQRLIEREIVGWTGLSRSTVRESIRQLEAEGLVKSVPQKGAFVAELTLREAQELYEIRSILECLATRQFVERATPAQVKALRRSFEGFRRIAEGSGEISSMLQAKKRFYSALFNGAANSVIEQILGGLQARITSLRATSMSQPGRLPAMVEEVSRIVEAIEAHDASAAERACADHVRSAGSVAVQALTHAQTGG